MHPPVGTYIAILGVAATVMSLMPPANKWEKAVWMAGIVGLAVLEIQNLYHDRDVHDNAERAARQSETQAFKGIADGIDNAIKNSQKQFDVTMGQMGTTLKATQIAVENTRPRADVQLMNFNLTQGQSELRSGTPAYWDIHYRNVGTIAATRFLQNVLFYTGRRANIEDQTRIVKDFEDNWTHSVNEHRGFAARFNVIDPGPAHLTQFPGTFSQEEVEKLAANSTTVYLVARFIWSDPTGRWASDYCGYFEDPANIDPKTTILHQCLVGYRARYRVK